MNIPDNVDILLVEDSPFDAELTLTALETHKVANVVHHVKDGAEALEFLFAEGAYASRKNLPSPKLVLLDLKLPKVNGLDVLRKVKSDERLKTIPITVLTSSKEDHDVIESYRLGVNSYIVKPVGFDNFSEAIRHLGFYWMIVNRPLQ